MVMSIKVPGKMTVWCMGIEYLLAWENDWHGPGVLTWADGNVYEDAWIHGKGKLTHVSGSS